MACRVVNDLGGDASFVAVAFPVHAARPEAHLIFGKGSGLAAHRAQCAFFGKYHDEIPGLWGLVGPVLAVGVDHDALGRPETDLGLGEDVFAHGSRDELVEPLP